MERSSSAGPDPSRSHARHLGSLPSASIDSMWRRWQLTHARCAHGSQTISSPSASVPQHATHSHSTPAVPVSASGANDAPHISHFEALASFSNVQTGQALLPPLSWRWHAVHCRASAAFSRVHRGQFFIAASACDCCAASRSGCRRGLAAGASRCSSSPSLFL
eukprot:5631108-Prymnesium_polylepis.2